MSKLLLLVDIQNDYFAGGKMALVNMEQAAENARQLLMNFRSQQLPVIHIQHFSTRPGATFFLPNTEGADIHSTVAPQSNELIISKNFPNSFRDTNLLQTLQQLKITELVIAGAMSHMCIDATTRAAFDYGFKCTVAHDACATRDLILNNQTVKAAEVHAAFMAALQYVYADVVSTQQLI